MALHSLSLCAGIAGLDLGVDLACRALGSEARTVCYVERGIEAAEILAARIAEGSLAEACIYSELESFDGRAWRGKVHCLTAGLPCQPYSVAGRRRGEGDDRYIWPEFFRILNEVRPALVFLENVPAFLTWFRPVGEELSSLGYRFEAGIYSAEEVGASHRRERFFCLAHCDHRQRGEAPEICPRGLPTPDGGRALGDAGSERPERQEQFGEIRGVVLVQPSSELPDPEGLQREGEQRREPNGSRPSFPPSPTDPGWRDIIREHPEFEPAVCRVADGPAPWLDRVIEERPARLQTLGNAVVPLTAAVAFVRLWGELMRTQGSLCS